MITVIVVVIAIVIVIADACSWSQISDQQFNQRLCFARDPYASDQFNQ